MELEIGAIQEGKVTGITKFGAFVLLPGGTSGLVHISEIANAYVSDVNDYLKVGDTVKRGDVLCIIEAMKLMNEITAECDGEVVDICIENGQVVEFGQTLLKLF